MMITRHAWSLLVAAVLLLGAAADVCAQADRDPRAARPYRGLFGRDNPPDENGRALDLTLSLFGGYDDDITAQQRSGVGQPSTQASSKYLGGSSQLRYRRQEFGKLNLLAQAGTNSSVYTDLDNLVATGANAGIGLDWTINGRTSLSLSQHAAFSPFYAYGVFPSAGVETPLLPDAPTFDTRVTKNENLILGSYLAFTRRFSSRTAFQASANYSRTDFRTNAAQRDGEHYGARALFTHALTSRARARLGYGYQTGRYGGTNADGLRSHSIDAGVDYARALSFSRNTLFSFSMGSAIYNDTQVTRYLVVGNAQLSHRLGRTWQALATYSRNLQLVDGFQDPFFTDAVAVGLFGYLGRRVVVRAQTGVSWGQLGLSQSDAYNRTSRTVYVTPSLQYALTEFLALQSSYFYYIYRFDPGAAPLPAGFDREQERQGVRVSLVVWLPLLR